MNPGLYYVIVTATTLGIVDWTRPVRSGYICPGEGSLLNCAGIWLAGYKLSSFPSLLHTSLPPLPPSCSFFFASWSMVLAELLNPTGHSPSPVSLVELSGSFFPLYPTGQEDAVEGAGEGVEEEEEDVGSIRSIALPIWPSNVAFPHRLCAGSV